MAHENAMIGTIGVSLGLVFRFGFTAERPRVPPPAGHLPASGR
jgi:predicted Kef-type K+ transport protein